MDKNYLCKLKTYLILSVMFLSIILFLNTSQAVLISNSNFVGKVEFTPSGSVVQGYDRATGDIVDVDTNDRIYDIGGCTYIDNLYYRCNEKYYRPQYDGRRLVYVRFNL